MLNEMPSDLRIDKRKHNTFKEATLIMSTLLKALFRKLQEKLPMTNAKQNYKLVF